MPNRANRDASSRELKFELTRSSFAALAQHRNPQPIKSMRLKNPCRPLPTPKPKLVVNSTHVMNRWKAQVKRVKPSGPNYLRIACQSLKMAVRCQQRIMRLAPLLFNNHAIEREIALRLSRPANSRTLVALSQIPNPSVITKQLRAEISNEAWNNLSPDKLAALTFEWRIFQLATKVTLQAWTTVHTKVDVSTLSFSEILTLLVLPAELVKAHFWTVPPQVQLLESNAPLGVQPADGAAIISPKTPPIKPSQSLEAVHSNNIIRLTTFLSEMHAEEEAASSSSTVGNYSAVAV